MSGKNKVDIMFRHWSDHQPTAWGSRPDEFTTTKEQGADTLTWREREGGLSHPNPKQDIDHSFKKRNKKEIGIKPTSRTERKLITKKGQRYLFIPFSVQGAVLCLFIAE